MAGALPIHIRWRIIEEKASGKKLLDISEQHHLSYSSVRNIYRRYQREGPEGLGARYERCGPKRGPMNTVVHRAAVWLKRHHPRWGGGMIRTLLQERYGPVVSVRTLQRWFKAAGLAQVKSSFPAVGPGGRWAKEVHDAWQVDAKEQLTLPSNQRACYLNVVDEKSGSLLNAFVFPPLLYQ